MLFITHNLGVVGVIADRVLVLEAGVVREEGSAVEVLNDPKDPYTQNLVRAAPRLPDDSTRTSSLPAPE